MSFFKNLSQINLKHVLLDIHFDQDIATVCVIPKNPSDDKALSLIKPLFVTTKIDAIDAIFFDRISKPLENTQIEFSNTLEYEKQLKKQALLTAQNKERSSKIEKLEIKLKPFYEIETFTDAQKTEASKLIVKIMALDPKNNLANKINSTLSQGGLF